jgi:hypothetical protein
MPVDRWDRDMNCTRAADVTFPLIMALAPGSMPFRGAPRHAHQLGEREVRVVPVVASGTGEPVAFLDGLCRELDALGHRTEVGEVPYRFQRGGDRMLRIRVDAALDTGAGG